MYGFEIYNGQSFPLDEKEILKRDLECSNEDYIFMKCPDCGAQMKFEGGPSGMIDGLYKCPSCGVVIDETEAYDILADEVDEFDEELKQQMMDYYNSDQSLYDICNGD